MASGFAHCREEFRGAMSRQYETLVHERSEGVWNAGNESAIERLLAEGGLAHALKDEWGVDVVGPAGFARFYRRYKAAFPDILLEVAQTVSEGDSIAVRYIARGTHRGDTIGMVATNLPIEFGGICMFKICDGSSKPGTSQASRSF